MLEKARLTDSDETAVTNGEHAKQLAHSAWIKNYEVDKDGKSVVVALQSVGNAKFEWHKTLVKFSRSMLGESIDGVELLKAAYLHVESEQNETRVVEEQHDERWREGERTIDPEPRQLVCCRFWRERALILLLLSAVEGDRAAAYVLASAEID